MMTSILASIRKTALYAAFFGACLSIPAASSAQLPDIAVVGLVGSGVDSGDADNNPYLLQLGAAAELTFLGYVVGVRGTRSLGSSADCATSSCTVVKDLRTFGADLGFDWEFALLHVSPRLGVGRLTERDGDIAAIYLEPGAVADIEILLLTLGAELRYRVAIKEPDANGLLAYLRVGLRF